MGNSCSSVSTVGSNPSNEEDGCSGLGVESEIKTLRMKFDVS